MGIVEVKHDPITVTDPAGKSVTVRAVPKGEMLRGLGTDGSLLSVALEVVVAVAVAARSARSTGWTVGVVTRSALRGEPIAHKENLPADADVGLGCANWPQPSSAVRRLARADG